MITQTNRHPMRPAHVHFLVNAKGYEPLITHVFVEGDEYIDSDVVFGVKDELIAKVERRTDPVMPDGQRSDGPWSLMSYEFHVKPGAAWRPRHLAPSSPKTPDSYRQIDCSIYVHRTRIELIAIFGSARHVGARCDKLRKTLQ